MTTMIEKVAVAIAEKLAPALSGGAPVKAGELARAAISAMREPTDEMQEAGEWYAGSQASECFTAMIDAVLKDQA